MVLVLFQMVKVIVINVLLMYVNQLVLKVCHLVKLMILIVVDMIVFKMVLGNKEYLLEYIEINKLYKLWDNGKDYHQLLMSNN